MPLTLVPVPYRDPANLDRILSRDLDEKVAISPVAVIANGTNTLWTITGGPIEVLELIATCVTANDTTATTVKFNVNPTGGSSTDVSAATASLASANAGTIVLCTGTFATAASVNTAGVVAAGTTKFIVGAGTVRYIAATGPSTGTWQFQMRYKALQPGVTVG